MRFQSSIMSSVIVAIVSLVAESPAPSVDVASAMHWRQIGPPRAGRARALAGVPSQPNVFYIGFDNGGVWRSTDYGSNWQPIFDRESTGSIGAIAVAPSDPNILYVGSGGGIIRPDLATGTTHRPEEPQLTRALDHRERQRVDDAEHGHHHGQ